MVHKEGQWNLFRCDLGCMQIMIERWEWEKHFSSNRILSYHIDWINVILRLLIGLLLFVYFKISQRKLLYFNWRFLFGSEEFKILKRSPCFILPIPCPVMSGYRHDFGVSAVHKARLMYSSPDMVHAYYFHPKPFFPLKSVSLLGWEDGKSGGFEQVLGKHTCAFLFPPPHM